MSVNDSTILEMQNKMGDMKKRVLNIVNKKDILAYVWNRINVENFEYKSSNGLFYWRDNPLISHTDYWTSNKVMKKIIEKIKNS